MFEKAKKSEQKFREQLAKTEAENRFLKEENKRLIEDNIRLRRPQEDTVDRTQEEEKK
jgi:hypothetical protein